MESRPVTGSRLAVVALPALTILALAMPLLATSWSCCECWTGCFDYALSKSVAAWTERIPMARSPTGCEAQFSIATPWGGDADAWDDFDLELIQAIGIQGS